MSTPTQPDSSRKQLIRAVITLITLDKERRRGTLDAAGTTCLQEAEAMLAARSGRAVTAVFLDWFENPVRFDPRARTAATASAEEAPRELGRQAAILQRRNRN